VAKTRALIRRELRISSDCQSWEDIIPPTPPAYDLMAGRFSLRTLDRTCFIVRDANGQALAYVHFEGETGRARGGEAPHPDMAFAYATPS
jgi:hypothetical protein